MVQPRYARSWRAPGADCAAAGWIHPYARCSLAMLAAATLLIGGTAADSREIWERDWIEVRTENFIVASTIGRKQTAEIARRLENFRALMTLLASPQRADPRDPIKVYLLSRPLPEIGLSADLRGYSLPTDPSIIVLRRSRTTAESVQHEYAHLFVRSRDPLRYPPWLDEGLAELLSTIELDGESFHVGKPPTYAMSRLRNLRWLEYSRVLAVHDPRELDGVQRAMFYYQSWLLVHYLNWGRMDRNYRRDTARYLRRVAAGVPADAAFAESFDLEITKLAPVLRAYGSRLRYREGTLGARFAEAESRLRQMRPDQVAAGIGEILMVRGELASARRYFESALNIDHDNANAQVGIAEVLTRQGDDEKAAAWWRAAAEQGDSEAQFRLGVLYDNGIGVERNYYEAYAWARAAAIQGVDEARELQKHLLGKIADIEHARELARDYVEKFVLR